MSPATAVVLIVTCSLVLTFALSIAIGRENLQSFVTFGKVKRYSLPIIYILFLWVFMRRRLVDGSSWWRNPGWVPGALSVLFVSTFTSMAFGYREIIIANILQGVGLVVGFLLYFQCGRLSGGWSTVDQERFVGWVGGLATLASLLGVGMGAFAALQIPAAFGLFYVGFRRRRWRFHLLSLSALLFGTYVVDLVNDPNASSAQMLEVGGCLAIVVYSMVPVLGRRIVAWGGLFLAAILILPSSTFALMLGRVPEGVTDVTLLQRAYEARAVWEAASQNPLSLVLGLGPGGTVDLSGSPDWGTLLASGRDLGRVPAVHFLTSWSLLKMGLVGVVLVAWICLYALRILYQTLTCEKSVGWFEVFNSLFVWAGFASSITAATNLFVNPLFGVCLGILAVRLAVGGKKAVSKVHGARTVRPVEARGTRSAC